MPAKQGLFRNVASTIVRCKELLDWNKDEEQLSILQSTSVCPVALKKGKLYYEVEMDDKKKQVSVEEALVHIYKKLYGKPVYNLEHVIQQFFIPFVLLKSQTLLFITRTLTTSP